MSSIDKQYRFPHEIIAHCVWLYHRFTLSLREIELLTEIAEDADAHRAAAEAEYDSAERRDALVADMNAGGVDKETIGARMTADLDQAKHPRGAVQTGTGKPPVAKKGRPSKGRSQERQHSGR